MKRILVALDTSPRAPKVLAAAVKLAESSGAKLVLFRAVGVPPDFPRELLTYSGDHSLEDYLITNARRDLEQTAKGVPADRIEKVEAVLGTAWDAICTTARETSADLIVIGSHGYGTLDRVLGTTAAKVVNHADRNVLVVRTPL
jgi:nucleotide-binding universal stress UspA family protein